MKAKTERNQRLIEFRKNHPFMTLEATANIFHISKQRAHQIVKRNLYQCSHTRVRGNRIYCAKEHRLHHSSQDGNIELIRLARGEPLELSICQNCPDFDSMGEPVAQEDRGWNRKPAIDRIKMEIGTRREDGQNTGTIT